MCASYGITQLYSYKKSEENEELITRLRYKIRFFDSLETKFCIITKAKKIDVS